MWYLNRGDRLDMNVQEAWMEGATGKGISVTILVRFRRMLGNFIMSLGHAEESVLLG